jgi:phenylacetate-CoA ligase
MHTLVARAKAVHGVLPPGLRDMSASAYGWYLRWWRYAQETESLVAAALERDYWTADQWRKYQDERLTMLLHRAATRVPYYRELWRQRRASGDTSSCEELRNWPVLDKEKVRCSPERFLADDVAVGRLSRLTTSGTSGTPLTTWRSRRTSIEWYALFEARARVWYGVNHRMRWAILGGQVVVPAKQVEPPFWVWNAGLRQLYLSSLHLSERNVGAYIDALRRYRVRHLYGYPSSMYWLAIMARACAVEAPRLEVVVSNAELLLPHQRAVITEVFDCPVRNTYGMSEIASAATECHDDALHVWPDAGVVEVLDDNGEQVEQGQVGRLVCTGLLNLDMPLVRYDVGDRGALGRARTASCGCGRLLPTLDRIEGRSIDNLVTADGRRVYAINPVFQGLPIREGQVVQEAIDLVHVNVVCDAGYASSVDEIIRDRIQERLGCIRVEVHCVPAIPRGANGKFRSVINCVPALVAARGAG